jgi:hypothetical protein
MAVSGALVQEREIWKGDKKTLHQVPIYFVSEALAGSKKYYLEIEKICYAIGMSARKLWHYFEVTESGSWLISHWMTTSENVIPRAASENGLWNSQNM